VELLDRLRAARARTLEAVRRTPDARFGAPVLPHWPDLGPAGPKSAAWLTAYALQHTWEHLSAISGAAVFAPA
jgi:hypothetical protein